MIAIQGLTAAHTTAIAGLAHTATQNDIGSKADIGVSESERDEMMEAARGFEAIFMQFMLKTMRAAVPKGGLFEESFAGGMYEEMHDTELSQQLVADGKGLGLAEMLYQDLTRQRHGTMAYQSAAVARASEMSVGAVPGLVK